jgi:hypothetical protein
MGGGRSLNARRPRSVPPVAPPGCHATCCGSLAYARSRPAGTLQRRARPGRSQTAYPKRGRYQAANWRCRVDAAIARSRNPTIAQRVPDRLLHNVVVAVPKLRLGRPDVDFAFVPVHGRQAALVAQAVCMLMRWSFDYFGFR